MSLEFQSIGTIAHNRPTLVFLHEGLGSISTWRQFPQHLCNHSQLPGLVYSRTGYGQSDPFDGPLDEHFMHSAALELATLLEQHDVGMPVLVGHSDGASIALIYAAMQNIEVTPQAIVTMAPHLFVEPICTEAIWNLRESYVSNDRLRAGLQRHHKDADLTFKTWTDAWLAPAFAHWNIEEEVSRINTPVLAIQGKQDQYGTLRQVERLTELVPQATCHALDDCGHSPHQDQLDTVTGLIVNFLAATIGR